VKIGKFEHDKLSFPNTGGATVSGCALSANFHRLAFRKIGSETRLFWSIFYHILGKRQPISFFILAKVELDK
jgi:hypothetical protein